MENCRICGKTSECTHHLLFGKGIKPLADADGIKMRCCNNCHNMAIKASDRIHGNIVAEKFSKMLGQALWELNYISKGNNELKEEARQKFRERYGKSYL